MENSSINRDENGQERVEKPSIISVFVFYYEKREQERNNKKRKQKRDIHVTKMGRNWKLYCNALLFNHHSPHMNITLYTILCKLFF